MESILNPVTGENPTIAGLMMADLLKTIDAEEMQELGIQDEESEGYEIKDAGQADYFAGKVKELMEENKNVEATAKEAMERYAMKVEAWKENIVKSNLNQIDFFTSLLKQYAKKELEGKKTQSLKLINGTLKFRKQSPEYVYDDSTLTTYLQLLGDSRFLKEQAPKVDKTELKKAGAIVGGKFTLNGQEVPGITLNEREPKFEVA